MRAALDAISEDADEGHAKAQHTLAALHRKGRGVPQGDDLAVAWLRKAADQGYALAEYDLGTMYAEGKGGLPQRHDLAAGLFHKAANQGTPDAQYCLGRCYFLGRGVPKDDKVGMEWYCKAADQGLVEAQKFVANAYVGRGDGSRRKLDEAYYYACKAEEQGADMEYIKKMIDIKRRPLQSDSTVDDSIDLGARVEVKHVPQLKGRRGYVI
jgi:TPR repeat protein